MFKALLKKQLMEMFRGVFVNTRTGKRRQGFGLIGFLAIFVLAFFSLGFFFYTIAEPLAEAFITQGREWLYYAVMGIIALVIGVFLSVFSTYSALYQAKDNELLLSMPIPPRTILSSRMTGIYVTTLLYQAIAWIPTLIASWVQRPPTALQVVLQILLLFILGFFSLTLSSVLGWLVALAASKIQTKNKSFATLLFTICFLVVYYVFYFRLQGILSDIINNADVIGKSLRTKAYPLYLYGTAGDGNLTSFIMLTVIVAALLAVCIWVLARSFTRLTTTNRGAKKVKYREHRLKASGMRKALIGKELKRFTSSSSYMLNASMGTLLMVAMAVFMLIKAAALREALSQVFGGSMGTDFIYMIAAGGMCLLAGMNDITAPSVSLEGKTIWIPQSLPVRGSDALMAKIDLHLLLTWAPAALCTAALCIALRIPFVTSLCMVVLVLSYVLMIASSELALDVKRPNLTWSNEAYPLKQSLNIFIAVFGGWIVAAIVAAPYFLIRSISATLYMCLAALFCLIVSAVFIRWLRRKGAEIYSQL